MTLNSAQAKISPIDCNGGSWPMHKITLYLYPYCIIENPELYNWNVQLKRSRKNTNIVSYNTPSWPDFQLITGGLQIITRGHQLLFGGPKLITGGHHIITGGHQFIMWRTSVNNSRPRVIMWRPPVNNSRPRVIMWGTPVNNWWPPVNNLRPPVIVWGPPFSNWLPPDND